MGMMVSEPTLLASQISANADSTGYVFAADDRGTIFMVPLEGPDGEGKITPLPLSSWNIRAAATLQESVAAAANNTKAGVKHYALPYGLCADFDKSNGNIWLGGGTSNVMLKAYKDEDINEVRDEMKNDLQMIFGFRTKAVSAVTTHARDSFKNIKTSSNPETFTKLEPNDPQQGWYFKLLPESQNEGEEYVSAKPVVVEGMMFIATFREKERIDTENAADPCAVKRAVSGVARYYVLDIKTGEAALWTDEYGNLRPFIEINDAKIVNIGVRTTESAYYITALLDNLGNADHLLAFAGQKSTTTGANHIHTKITRVSNLLFLPNTTVINYWLMK
jgi:Tfp pilus tip-associated adhesin PilY1